MDNLLTAKDVAKHLRMHIITVYRLAEQGKIPGVKVGRQWRFHQDVIDEWARGRSRAEQRALLVRPRGMERHATLDALRNAGCEVQALADASALRGLLDKRRASFTACFVDSSADRRVALAVAREIANNAPWLPIVIVAAGDVSQLLDDMLEITHVTVVRAPLTDAQAQRILGTSP
ncbi:MAG: helix-turn-helix domain-containing protein [Armatimonadota bacterium]